MLFNRHFILAGLFLFIVLACVSFSPATQAAPTAISPTGGVTASTREESPGVTPTLAPSPTLPAPTQPPAPTQAAGQTAITANNAGDVKQVGQVSFDNPFRLIWSLDGSTVTVLSNTSLVIYDPKTLENKGSVVFKSPIVLLDFSADGHTMASTSDQTSVELRDVTTGKTLQLIKPAAPFSNLAFSPDGKSMVMSSTDEIEATLWNVDSGQQTAKIGGFETAAPVYDVSFTPDGKSLIWHARATVQLEDINTLKFSPTFDHEDFVSSMAMSSDGKLLATSAGGTVDGVYLPLVTIWDTQSGKSLGVIKLADGDVCTALAFAPGSHFLAGGVNTQVLLWDADTDKQVGALQGHTDRVSVLAFSPDGKTLASAAADNSMRLWQVKP